MVRTKMALKLIEGEKAEQRRKVTFTRRSVAIKKKAMELGKLCDIVTLVVCFGPGGELKMWPEDAEEARRIVQRYQSLKPEDDRIKRRYDLGTFFEGHLKKVHKDLHRHRDAWLDGLPADSLNALAQSLDSKLAAIDDRIRCLKLQEEGNTGKEIQILGARDHQHSQLHRTLMLEEAPSAGAGASPPPTDTIILGKARPTQSFKGMELLDVMPKEYFRGKGLQDNNDSFAAAAAACVLGAPHAHHCSEMPCSLPHSSLDPYLQPMIADHSLHPTDMISNYLENPIFSNPMLAADFSPYIGFGVTCTSSVLDPAMGFPLPLYHDDSLDFNYGVQNLTNMADPFEHPFGPRYDYKLHHLPAATMCNDVYHQIEPYGADEFLQRWNIAQPLATTSSTSSHFHGLPPNGCSGSRDSVQAVVPGGEDSMFVPTYGTNPYTGRLTGHTGFVLHSSFI